MSKKKSSLPERKVFPVPLGDRGETNSEIREHRLPRSDSRRRRRRNPFSDRCRNNFPDIDGVFKSTTPSSHGPINGDNGFYNLGGNTFDDEDEDGCCQHSDIDASSVLNMSIGARAALNEHARYVAKFGIDGEINVEMGIHNNTNYSSDETNSEACTNVLLDDQWERILDLSRVASSIGGSISEGIPSPPNSTTVNLYFESSSGEKSKFEESASIEVMTDVSCDFFNSSRVNLLITPERNKNYRTEMVITRERVGADDNPLSTQLGSSFDNESEIFGYQIENSEQENVLGVDFDRRQGQNDANLQGSSFNLGDISRITNNTFSDANFTLDASFQNDQKQDVSAGGNKKDNDYGFGFTGIFGTASPSIILNDSSFFSSSEKQEDRENQESISAANDRKMSTAGLSPEKSSNSSSSIKSVVSSFFAEACTFAKQVASDVEKSIEGIDSLPAEFLRGIDICQSDAPSPISQVLSSHSSRQEGSTTEQGILEKAHVVDLNNSNSADTNTRCKTTSSLASSGVEDSFQIHLTGRKRYRTVVPRRVYLDVPTQQSNEEEQDSFFAVQSNPETTRVGRILLESFEEVATNKTY